MSYPNRYRKKKIISVSSSGSANSQFGLTGKTHLYTTVVRVVNILLFAQSTQNLR